MKNNLIPYLVILPSELEVEIHRAEEGGFWAKVKNLPGCVTQGENFMDLIEMVNDAVFTYLEIPGKYRKALGYYVPNFSENIKGRLAHKQIERLVAGIIKNRKSIEFSRT